METTLWLVKAGGVLHDSGLQMGKSFSSLHLLNPDVIGKVFPEP